MLVYLIEYFSSHLVDFEQLVIGSQLEIKHEKEHRTRLRYNDDYKITNVRAYTVLTTHYSQEHRMYRVRQNGFCRFLINSSNVPFIVHDHIFLASLLACQYDTVFCYRQVHY